jgi:hypothetical protein
MFRHRKTALRGPDITTRKAAEYLEFGVWSSMGSVLPALLLLQTDGIGEAADSIQPDRIGEHIAYLASDDLEGRLSGYPGSVKAAEYIARHLKEAGLRPLGDSGSWLQKFHPDRQRKLTGHNVVAYLEGSDEKLRSECVVLGAHYDHVGTAEQEHNPGRIRKPDDPDRIWNGADDNASGTAALLEIARVLSGLKGRPRRSVVIVFFGAEEWGLVGSNHFVNEPPAEFPLERMAAMVNLDMVGRNSDLACVVSGVGTCEAWEKILPAAAEAAGARMNLLRLAAGGSDHASFARKKIPAVHFFSGFHGDYHRPSDHADRVDPAHAARLARAVLHAACAVGDLPEKPRWKESPGRPSGERRRMGTRSAENLSDEEATRAGLGADEGGIRVGPILPDGAADKAKMKEGDVIVEFHGQKLPRKEPLERLRDYLRQVEEGVEVSIVVLRNGERVKLKAVWGSLRRAPDDREY